MGFSVYILAPRGDEIEEDDTRIRLAFAKALFQKDGGKKSSNSYYWLGDYKTTKIGFDPDYEYEPAFKDEPLFHDQYLYLGISMAKLAARTNSEQYFYKSIEYFKLSTKINKNNAIAYMNWQGALLWLAQIRGSENLYLESLKKIITGDEIR